jgi:hypothetical protein
VTIFQKLGLLLRYKPVDVTTHDPLSLGMRKNAKMTSTSPKKQHQVDEPLYNAIKQYEAAILLAGRGG